MQVRVLSGVPRLGSVKDARHPVKVKAAGSIPVRGANIIQAPVAQLIERLSEEQKVAGSTPAWSTKGL